MTKRVFVLFITTIFGEFTYAQCQSKKISTVKGQFSVIFPCSAKNNSENQINPNGEILQVEAYLCKCDDKIFQCSSLKAPDGYRKGRSLD